MSNLANTLSTDGTAHDGAGSEFLAFTLGSEEYGIDILKVQEIRGYEAVTRIANAPEFIKGVINLRGIIIPVVDMRIKFKLGTPVYDQFTVVIILNVADTVLGVVVDSVADVVNLALDAIRPTPQFQSQVDEAFIKGIATIEERMLIVMDIEALLSSADMGLLKAAVA